jgi:hypothetical protein
VDTVYRVLAETSLLRKCINVQDLMSHLQVIFYSILRFLITLKCAGDDDNNVTFFYDLFSSSMRAGKKPAGAALWAPAQPEAEHGGLVGSGQLCRALPAHQHQPGPRSRRGGRRDGGGGGGEPVFPLWSAGDAGASMSSLCLGGPAGSGQHDGRERRLHQVLFRVFPALGRTPAQWPRDKVIYWAGDESKHWAGMVIVNGNNLAIRHCQWCRIHCNKLAI